MRRARRRQDAVPLQLTSLMDVMTLLLVFLLQSFGATDPTVAASAQFELPVSTATDHPRLAVNVVVTTAGVVVDGTRVLPLEERIDERGAVSLVVPEAERRGPLILRLHEHLTERADAARRLADASRPPGSEASAMEFRGELLVQCDRRVPFSVLRDVLHTAGEAGFDDVRFGVIGMGG